MRGTVAKRLRKRVYGEDGASRGGKHFIHKIKGLVICDEKRQTYKKLKKAYTKGEISL